MGRSDEAVDTPTEGLGWGTISPEKPPSEASTKTVDDIATGGEKHERENAADTSVRVEPAPALPRGGRLVLITIAVALAVFLSSLDQVSNPLLNHLPV